MDLHLLPLIIHNSVQHHLILTSTSHPRGGSRWGSGSSGSLPIRASSLFSFFLVIEFPHFQKRSHCQTIMQKKATWSAKSVMWCLGRAKELVCPTMQLQQEQQKTEKSNQRKEKQFTEREVTTKHGCMMPRKKIEKVSLESHGKYRKPIMNVMLPWRLSLT